MTNRMASPIRVIDRAELALMPTGSLLARLRRLLACEQDRSCSDETAELPGVEQVGSEKIRWKDSSEWRAAYGELKEILSGREHIPSASQRIEKRTIRAKGNRTKERRKRK